MKAVEQVYRAANQADITRKEWGSVYKAMFCRVDEGIEPPYPSTVPEVLGWLVEVTSKHVADEIRKAL